MPAPEIQNIPEAPESPLEIVRRIKEEFAKGPQMQVINILRAGLALNKHPELADPNHPLRIGLLPALGGLPEVQAVLSQDFEALKTMLGGKPAESLSEEEVRALEITMAFYKIFKIDENVGSNSGLAKTAAAIRSRYPQFTPQAPAVRPADQGERVASTVKAAEAERLAVKAPAGPLVEGINTDLNQREDNDHLTYEVEPANLENFFKSLKLPVNIPIAGGMLSLQGEMSFPQITITPSGSGLEFAGVIAVKTLHGVTNINIQKARFENNPDPKKGGLGLAELQHDYSGPGSGALQEKMAGLNSLLLGVVNSKVDKNWRASRLEVANGNLGISVDRVGPKPVTVNNLVREITQTFNLEPERSNRARVLIEQLLQREGLVPRQQFLEIFKSAVSGWERMNQAADQKTQQRGNNLAARLLEDSMVDGDNMTVTKLRELSILLTRFFEDKGVKKTYPKLAQYLQKVKQGRDTPDDPAAVQRETLALINAMETLKQIQS